MLRQDILQRFGQVLRLVLLGFVFLGLGVASFSPLRAQSVTSEEEQRGVDIATRFSKKMSALKTFRAVVGFSIEHPQWKSPRSYNATLEAQRPAFYFSGMGHEIYSDGVSRWQYIPAQKEVVVMRVDSTSLSPIENPLRLFSHLGTNFRIYFQGERTEGKERYYDLSLYPHDLNAPYSQIHVALHQETLYPAKFSYIGRDGVNYVVSISSFSPNAKVRTNFALDTKALKGVKVTDLR